MWLLPQSNLLIYDHWMSLEPGTTIRKQPTVDPSWKQSIDCLKIVQGLVNYPRYYPCAFREKICPPCWGYRFFYWSWPHLISSQIQPTPLEFPIFLHWPPWKSMFFSQFLVYLWNSNDFYSTLLEFSVDNPMEDYNPFLEKPIMLKELY